MGTASVFQDLLGIIDDRLDFTTMSNNSFIVHEGVDFCLVKVCNLLNIKIYIPLRMLSDFFRIVDQDKPA